MDYLYREKLEGYVNHRCEDGIRLERNMNRGEVGGSQGATPGDKTWPSR